MRTRLSRLIIGTTALALASSAVARDEVTADNSYLEALKACRAESVDANRLACFDKAVASLLAASDEGDLRVVDKEEVRQTRRKLFGFSLPSLGIFGKHGKEKPEMEDIDRLDTTVASARRSSDRLIVTTPEGAVWEVQDPPRRLMTPKPGTKLEIRSGMLSSYFLRFGNQPGVKGRRVQ